MVKDNALVFAAALAITNSKVSTILDAKTIRDFGRGQELYLNIYLSTVFTTAANGLSVQIVSSSGADPGSTDVFQTIFGPRLASAMLNTGYICRMAWPIGVPYERVGLYFLATTALVAGILDAFLTIGQETGAILIA